MFLVDMDTPMWKIDALEKRFLDYLRLQPQKFMADKSSVILRDTTAANQLKLAFYAVGGGCESQTHYVSKP